MQQGGWGALLACLVASSLSGCVQPTSPDSPSSTWHVPRCPDDGLAQFTQTFAASQGEQAEQLRTELQTNGWGLHVWTREVGGGIEVGAECVQLRPSSSSTSAASTTTTTSPTSTSSSSAATSSSSPAPPSSSTSPPNPSAGHERDCDWQTANGDSATPILDTLLIRETTVPRGGSIRFDLAYFDCNQLTGVYLFVGPESTQQTFQNWLCLSGGSKCPSKWAGVLGVPIPDSAPNGYYVLKQIILADTVGNQRNLYPGDYPSTRFKVVAPGTEPSETPPPGPRTGLNPIADASVKSSAPDQNFGSASPLTAWWPGDTTELALVSFTLPQATSGACLVLRTQDFYNENFGHSAIVRGYSSAWSELTVNWNALNQSALGDTLDGSTIYDSGWYYFDVSPWIAAKTGLVSFAVSLNNNGQEAWHFSSREGFEAPRLIQRACPY